MPQSSSTKKHDQDPTDSTGPTLKSQRTKMVNTSDDSEKKSSDKKLKELEVGVPIVYGNVAFWLGKKASEFQSEIFVRHGDLNVNGKSILGVLMLAAETGAQLTITAEGPDAEDAVRALTELVESRFGEDPA